MNVIDAILNWLGDMPSAKRKYVMNTLVAIQGSLVIAGCFVEYPLLFEIIVTTYNLIIGGVVIKLFFIGGWWWTDDE